MINTTVYIKIVRTSKLKFKGVGAQHNIMAKKPVSEPEREVECTPD